ncbi:MAG: hypothetical protein HY272_02555 [Gammaproteobacteria bacterium]|nr:hypothetical protein [Gammaproteobacteria bacterium]
MALYSLDKLIAETRRIARDYKLATGKPLGGVSNEIAQFDACRLLDLEPAPPGAEGGYDAVGKGSREGLKYQIKARVIYDEGKAGQRIGQLKLEQQWDSVLLVLLDENFEPYEIYEGERSEVTEAIKESNRSKRGMMSVARFKAVSRLVWTKERGEEEEVWDNRAG